MNKLLIIIILLLTGCANYGSVELGIGPASLKSVPDRMSGHEQFHLSATHRYYWKPWLVQETGWNHLSNGARYHIGNHPNVGMNVYSSQLKLRIGR